MPKPLTLQSRLDELTADEIGKIEFKSLPISDINLKIKHLEDGSLEFEAMASTDDVDEGNDVVEPEAFRSSLAAFMLWGTLLFNHDFFGMLIGQITEATIVSNGLHVKGVVDPTTLGKDVILLMLKKRLKAMSIGFFIKSRTDKDDGGRIIHDLELIEISIVNRPMNPHALIDGLSRRMAERRNTQEKGITMPTSELAELKSKVEQINTVQDEYSTKFDEAKAMREKSEQSLATLRSELEAFGKAGKTQQAGMNEKIERLTNALKADLVAYKETADALAKSVDYNRTLRPFSDLEWFGKQPGLEPLTKMETYLRAPVDLKSHPKGEILRQFRNLHDGVQLQRMMYRAMNRSPQEINNHKSFALYQELAGAIDVDIQKAISTSVAGSGQEWEPEVWSQELIGLYRLEARLSALFPTFNMTVSVLNWPLLQAKPSFFKGTQATTANPDQVTPSSLDTADIQFNAKKVWTNVPVSREAVQDLILFPLLDEIRNQMAFAFVDNLDSMILNGDTTVPHLDNGHSTDALFIEATAPETLWKGIRKHARDQSKTFDVQSTSADVGDGTAAFVAQDARHCRKILGKTGVRIRELQFIVSPGGYYEMLDFPEVTDASAWGDVSTFLSGVLNALDGVGITISSEHRDDLDSDGAYNDGSQTFSSILLVNRGGARLGEREMFFMEVDYSPKTQQFDLIASARMDFQEVWNSANTSQFWAAEGFNLDV